MTQIAIEDLINLVRLVEQQKGKYIKATLSSLEQGASLSPPTRKIVLDGFNNYTRSILRLLGYNVEE